MIKTIVFFTKVLVAAITSLLFTSCMMQDGKRGNGDIRTEARAITGDFTNIDVSNAIHVIIQPDAKTSVTVEAESNLLPLIKTSVENGTLYIAANESFSTDALVTVVVKMSKVEGIKADGASIVDAERNIVTERLTLDASAASIMNIETESDELNVSSASGSAVTLSGKSLKSSITASSGGLVEARKLMVNDVSTTASSGGNITVAPIVNLEAKASSGGFINYTREPKTKSITESSGGTVSK